MKVPAILRYSPTYDGDMEEDADGEYVLYGDMLAHCPDYARELQMFQLEQEKKAALERIEIERVEKKRQIEDLYIKKKMALHRGET